MRAGEWDSSDNRDSSAWIGNFGRKGSSQNSKEKQVIKKKIFRNAVDYLSSVGDRLYNLCRTSRE